MNQITLDSALTALTKGSVPAAVLVEEQNYQALLHIGKEGIGQLKLHTPAGMVLIQDARLNLPALQGQLMVQVSQALSGQLQLKLSQNGPQPMPVQLTQPQLQQLVTQLNSQPELAQSQGQTHLASAQLSPQLTAQLSTQQSSAALKTLHVPVQIQRQDQQLILQLTQHKVQLPLPAALQALPANQWLDAKLQLKAGQLSLVLPKIVVQHQLKETVATASGHSKSVNPIPAKTAELQGAPSDNKTTQQTPSPQSKTVISQATAAPLPEKTPPARTSPTASVPEPALAKVSVAAPLPPSGVIPLTAAAQQRLLPLVLPALSAASSGVVLSLNELKQLPLPAATKQQLVDQQYQLQLSPQGQLQLKAIPEQKTVLIEPQPKVLQVQSVKTDVSPVATEAPEQLKFSKPQIEPAVINQAWRQLLPMLSPEWDNLAEAPELPEAVKAVLQLVKQSQPDVSKLTNLAQLPAQLQALMQFNPLQTVTLPQTAAGTLAVAIQLLLGRLGQPLPQNDKGPNKDHKLKEFVAQLDQAQSSQLLKQLSSQSSSVQHAQLSTLEQQSKDPLQQIFLTLPIQNQHLSDFCQIAISQQEEEQDKGKGKSTQWQLSMKFDLKHLGQLLAISKLSGSSLSLQLYTDTTSLKLLAEKYLPLLKDRCKAQGIDVKEAHCQLGKIPDSLMPKTTSLLAIRV